MRRITAALVLFWATALLAAPTDPCSLTSSVSDVALNISFKDQRASFREGEIVPLVLSFTSTADKRYWADVRNYDRSGRLTIESYCLDPAAPDPEEDYFRHGGFLGGGLGSTQQLSDKPFIAEAELNEWRQPKSGHYRLFVVSHRVWRPPDPGEPTPYGRVGETIRSNIIEFDVVASDAAWQAEQLRDAVTGLKSATPEQARVLARKLRFLNTRESVDALVQLYWGLNDQVDGWDLMFGLYSSPYREEAIGAMRRQYQVPDHPISQEFLRTVVDLVINSDRAWDSPKYDPAQGTAYQDFWRRRQDHFRELMRAEVSAVAAALPQKTGRAHALTVQALAESADLLGSAPAARIRKELIASWGDLPDAMKLQLIQYRWPLIAGPEMLPILLEFVSRPAPPAHTDQAMARDASLKHIYELDPAQGRALILRDVRNPRAQPSLALVKLLSSEELRPAIDEVESRLVSREGRELDYHLLELYGTSEDRVWVETLFDAHLGQWACDPQGAMLRFLLRVDPANGLHAVEASMAARKTTGCYHTLLQDLGPSLPKAESVAVAALDDPDLEVANDAALALGRWGTSRTEAALWARLKRFHQEWSDREAQLRPTPDYASPIARATALESNLVNAISTGTNWFCGPEKFARLRSLASPRQQQQIDAWSTAWERGNAIILPNWSPEDRLSFGVLQYSNLDEEQFRTKISQFPSGTKLYFQLWKPGQISPAITMERQTAVMQALRDDAARLGVIIEEKTSP